MESMSNETYRNYVLFGNSGSGKTSFINIVFGTNFKACLNNGKSCTEEVNAIHKKNDEIFGNAVIYDTPGMNDPDHSDEEIANKIIYGLLKNCKKGNLNIDGVIFVYKMSDKLNLDQFMNFMRNLSSSFSLENMCLLITHSKSFSHNMMKKYKEETTKMCSDREIQNYVFWDSEEPITDEENNQYISLRTKLTI